MDITKQKTQDKCFKNVSSNHIKSTALIDKSFVSNNEYNQNSITEFLLFSAVNIYSS